MTTTTTTNEKTMTDDQIKWTLTHQADVAKRRYEETQTAFLAAVQTNPADAIDWRSDDMAKAQARHEVWAMIERELAEHEPAEVLARNLAECRNRALSFCGGGSSTSAFSNAVARARAAALVREAEQIEGMMKSFGM